MGQTLSEPVIDKHSTTGGDERYLYGASAMQGWRISMEDAHTTLLKLGPNGESAFLLSTTATVARRRPILGEKAYSSGYYEDAIKSGFLSADAHLREKPEMTNDSSGCTAVGVLLTKDGTAYCGNAGDSRCIISSKGRAIALSTTTSPRTKLSSTASHRANNSSLPAEKQVVTAHPDVIKHTITADDEFIVVACDGIWDCMTNQQVAQFVHAKVVEGKKLDQICEDMMDRCLASESELGGVGCDNMTVVIVAILNGKTEEEWYAHVKNVAEETNMKSSPTLKKDYERNFEVSDLDIDADGTTSAIIKQALQSDEEEAAGVDIRADALEGNVAAAAAAAVAKKSEDN
ncbi:phosphatase 2C-like domain-containing protein [Kickxella alabastrina]|uniref:phosphatase 2C-like domain-containing protein n=1 Tax=Kickxella alabastrina TaxID=61397 RepID=UPI002220D4C5|nr:phosphatase 2C-like domain-containing protein [Kickxella alabastrina]KAI7824287.1 phosphatase 2C-like domain-containing protein [Kickxella alabastrina]